jgi:hypothetical protein
MFLARQRGRWGKKKMRGMNENVVIQDIFCSGLGAIEKLEGNCFRFYLYVSQASDDGGQEKLVVAKFIAPASAVPDAVLQMIAAMGDRAVKMIPMIADMVH